MAASRLVGSTRVFLGAYADGDHEHALRFACARASANVRDITIAVVADGTSHQCERGPGVCFCGTAVIRFVLFTKTSVRVGKWFRSHPARPEDLSSWMRGTQISASDNKNWIHVRKDGLETVWDTNTNKKRTFTVCEFSGRVGPLPEGMADAVCQEHLCPGSAAATTQGGGGGGGGGRYGLPQKGDHVHVRYKGKSKYYPGTIDFVRSDGTYNIAYDDGDREVRVPLDWFGTAEDAAAAEAAAAEAGDGGGGDKRSSSLSSTTVVSSSSSTTAPAVIPMAAPVQQEMRAAAAAAAPPPSAPVAADGAKGTETRLRELAALHKDGILSDAEFAAAKAKVIASIC